MTTTMPANEAGRLEALRSYRILDTGPEVPYDELTELAAQFCHCPVAVIGLIDETRDWKKSKYGLPPGFTGLPREMSICSSTICGNDLLYVPDLTKDDRFRDNPTVTGEPHLRTYCGMPLVTPHGHALGTLCVIDFAAHELSFEQTDAVRRLAHQVVAQLELRRNLYELDNQMQSLARMNAETTAEKDKSDRLLRNILPDAVAEELKANSTVVPKFFESATVMFADFEGFTRLTERMDPKGLVEQLDQFFSAFDEIAERHRMEKLKTIGDAYMCAGGLPVAQRTHPVDACLAALETQDYMHRVNRQREKLRLPRWDLRIGLHTGPVMAGVIGRKKFVYDVWGDAVNVASRMEAAGSAGRINISEATMHRVKTLFDLEDRETIEVKSKGRMQMYYLSRIKQQFSSDTAGQVPNEAFHRESARLFPGYLHAA